MRAGGAARGCSVLLLPSRAGLLHCRRACGPLWSRQVTPRYVGYVTAQVQGPGGGRGSRQAGQGTTGVVPPAGWYRLPITFPAWLSCLRGPWGCRSVWGRAVCAWPVHAQMGPLCVLRTLPSGLCRCCPRWRPRMRWRPGWTRSPSWRCRCVCESGWVCLAAVAAAAEICSTAVPLAHCSSSGSCTLAWHAGATDPPNPAPAQAFRCKACGYTAERRRLECVAHPYAVERVEVGLAGPGLLALAFQSVACLVQLLVGRLAGPDPRSSETPPPATRAGSPTRRRLPSVPPQATKRWWQCDGCKYRFSTVGQKYPATRCTK